MVNGLEPKVLLSTTRRRRPPMLVRTICRSVWLLKCTQGGGGGAALFGPGPPERQRAPTAAEPSADVRHSPPPTCCVGGRFSAGNAVFLGHERMIPDPFFLGALRWLWPWRDRRYSSGANEVRKPAWTAPRTPDGQPDLQGIWTNATLTPLERPAAMKDKAFLTEEEAAAIEKRTAENRAATDKMGPLASGSYNRVLVRRRHQGAGDAADLARRRSAGWARAGQAVGRSAARRLRGAQRRQLRVHEPVGSLHHARHSRLDVSRRLQQRVSDHPDARLRHHSSTR